MNDNEFGWPDPDTDDDDDEYEAEEPTAPAQDSSVVRDLRRRLRDANKRAKAATEAASAQDERLGRIEELLAGQAESATGMVPPTMGGGPPPGRRMIPRAELDAKLRRGEITGRDISRLIQQNRVAWSNKETIDRVMRESRSPRPDSQ